MMNTNYDDRRRAPRLKRNLRVDFCEGRPGHTINLSRSGLRMVVGHHLNTGDRVSLRLELSPQSSVSLTGKAVWRQPLGEVSSVVGLAFEGENPRLNRWLDGAFAA